MADVLFRECCLLPWALTTNLNVGEVGGEEENCVWRKEGKKGKGRDERREEHGDQNVGQEDVMGLSK